MRENLWRYLQILLLGGWLGGLTFYALVVVRVGNALLGGTQQGFVTQQVTFWLNLLGLLVACALLIEVWRIRLRATTITWCVFTSAQLGLCMLHVQMDRMLDGPTQSIHDGDTFYRWHQSYLWVTAGQWMAGLLLLWYATTRRIATSTTGEPPSTPF